MTSLDQRVAPGSGNSRGDPIVVVSDFCHVEFHAAVARLRRDGSLAARTAASLVSRFRREWADRRRVSVSHDVVSRAADLAGAHPLRSLDALHLASALVVSAGASEPLRFSAADERLLSAARAEGLVTLAAE